MCLQVTDSPLISAASLSHLPAACAVQKVKAAASPDESYRTMTADRRHPGRVHIHDLVEQIVSEPRDEEEKSRVSQSRRSIAYSLNRAATWATFRNSKQHDVSSSHQRGASPEESSSDDRDQEVRRSEANQRGSWRLSQDAAMKSYATTEHRGWIARPLRWAPRRGTGQEREVTI